MFASRLPDHEDRNGRLHQHIGSLTTKQNLLYALSTMGRYDYEIAPFQLGSSGNGLSRKFVDFMLHVYRDVILRGPLLNRLIPLLHILIDLLAVSAEGVVNAASNGCLHGRRFTLSGSVTAASWQGEANE